MLEFCIIREELVIDGEMKELHINATKLGLYKVLQIDLNIMIDVKCS